MVSWFLRILAALAIVLVAAFDTVTIVASHLSARDDANNAAGAVATYVAENKSTWTQAGAVAAARTDLSHGESVITSALQVQPDGDVTLTIHRTVTGRTLVAQHLGFLKKELSFDTTSTGSPTQS